EKVLLLANAPHPDVNAIRDALTGSPNYEIDYALFSDYNKSLKGFNLVILHGYGIENTKTLADCMTEKIPFWIVNPSNPMQLPGLKISNTLNKFNDSEPFYNTTFGLFAISPALQRFVGELPAIKTF